MEFEENLVKARIQEEVAKQSSVVERGSIIARGQSEAAQEMDIE
jgi:hypothetical protein